MTATACALLALLWLSARTARAARLDPAVGAWMGFGVSYTNPVFEADYLHERSPRNGVRTSGERLYNIFDSGSYLLWHLYPGYRVMTDSRAFPYFSWFADQYRFTDGEIFASFLARYPADLAVIDHRKGRCQRHFLDSPDWHAVFYGPTAAIFVRRGTEESGEMSSVPTHGGIDHLRNGGTALAVFDFACAASDLDQAWSVLEQLEGPLRAQVKESDLAVLRVYRDAYRAISRREFDHANALLKQALARRVPSVIDRLALDLLDQRAAALAAGSRALARQAEDSLSALGSGR